MIEQVDITISAKPTKADEMRAEHKRALSTLNEDGSRKWINPKPVEGSLYRKRLVMAWTLIAIFAVLPYIHFGGRQWVLLDIAHRRFRLFGFEFLPTDTELFALLMVGVFLSIFFFTALFGRVWCGWACPQTVYMEFVFRPIERFFTGTPGRTPKKGTLKGWLQTSGAGTALKTISYILVSLYLAHIFLAYFVGVDALGQWVTRSPFEHPVSFLVMAGVTVAMLLDFGFFREQMCIVMCPYGRMQSALLDKDSLIIAYDRARGEPRGKKKRGEPDGDVGDCVDCRKCVTCCPTGIDIRDGLQMECINCTQCIDACNEVMGKLGRPLNLIRYSSQAHDEGKPRKMLRPRTVVYPLIIALVFSLFGLLLSSKAGTELLVLRGKGLTYTAFDNDMIGNPFNLRVTNRSSVPRTYKVYFQDNKIIHFRSEDPAFSVRPNETQTVSGFILAPHDVFAMGKFSTTLVLESDDGQKVSHKVVLMGPAGGQATPARTEGTK